MTLLRDLRYALRMLKKDWGFTAVAVLALALGIGGNTAIFTVVDAVIFRPLPYQQPGRLVMVYESNRLRPRRNVISPGNFRDWRARNTVFEDMAAIRRSSGNLTGAGEPVQAAVQVVSGSFFRILGVNPTIGRTFLPEEDRPRARRVAVVSHRLWEQRFGKDPKITGRALNLNGESYDIVGVMPRSFQFLGFEVEIWLPARLDPAVDYRKTSGRYMFSVARLKPNVTLDRAQGEMTVIASALEREHPEFDKNWSALVVPLEEVVTGTVRRAMYVLLAAVGLVLVIACANIANLLLARASGRRREIAVRSSLGAAPRRLFRQMLTESLVLSALGGALGLGLAVWGVGALVALAPDTIPRLDEVRIDARVFSFTLLISVVAGIAFGIVPALQAARSNLSDALKEGGRSSFGPRSRTLPNALVAAEIAVSAVLLIGAGLLVRSFLRLTSVQPGFAAESLLTARVQLPGSRYNDTRVVSFAREALQKLRALPGVRAAGATSSLPMAGIRMATGFHVAGRPKPLEAELPVTDERVATPDYFRTMGIPLLRGRDFDERDQAKSPPVFVVNDLFVKKYFPGEDPIGRRISVRMQDENPYGEIVGVIGDIRDQALEDDVLPTVYYPHTQFPLSFMTFVIRTASDPVNLARAVTGTIRSGDPDLPVEDVKPMDTVLAESVARQRFNTLLLGLFAGLALALAVVGVYGVSSYSVAQRRREIGVRMAIGAGRGEVMRMVLGRGLLVSAIGLAIGLAGAIALTRLMKTLLFQVQAADPPTYAGAALVLLAVAALAVYIPARRATRVDPVVVLRHE